MEPLHEVYQLPKIVRIYTRSGWNAHGVEAKTEYPDQPRKHVLYTCTYSRTCYWPSSCRKRMRSISHTELLEHKRDVVFNFAVGIDFQVYEGRGWTIQPDLPRKHMALQDSSILIAFIGKPQDHTNDVLTLSHQLKQQIIDYGVYHGYIAPDYEEREIRRAAHRSVELPKPVKE